MKRVLLFIALISVAVASTAQNYYVDAENSEMLRFGDYHRPVRKEVVLPRQV